MELGFDSILESHEPIIRPYAVKEVYRVIERKFPSKLNSLKEFFESIDCDCFSIAHYIPFKLSAKS